MSIQFGKINNNIFVNSTATYENGIVSISSPENAEKINFYAPSNANDSDLYEINGKQVILSNILNNNPEITWVKGAPISAVYDSQNNKLFINSINGENSVFSNLFRNANAQVVENKIVINSVEEAVDLFNFYSPKAYSANDIYEVNGQVYDVVDLQGNKLETGWNSDVPVSLVLNENKLWYSSNGSDTKLPSDLSPLCPNFVVERTGGKVKISADKIQLNSLTSMVSGGVWAWGKTRPTKPGGENTKLWSRSELITTGKPYDGLYLGDVTPSDAVTETLIYLPENEGGSVKLVPFIVLSTDYLGGVYLMRKYLWMLSTYTGKYPQSNINTLLLSGYKTSVLVSDISAQVMVVPLPVYGESGDIYETDFFVPSMAELNFGTGGDIPTEGTMMPYFSSVQRRYAYVSQEGEKSGAKQEYWSRTGSISNSTSKYYVNDDGGKSTSGFTSTQWYIRPSFVLPKDFKIQQRPDGSYTVWNMQGLLTLGDIDASTESSATILNGAEDLKSGGQSITSFIYAQKRYSGNDGALLVREKVYFQTPTSTSYSDSDVSKQAVNYTTASASSMSYPKVLSSSLQKLVKEATFKWRAGNGNQLTMKAKGFVLSASDLSEQYSGWNMGTVIPYFKSSGNRIVREEINNAISAWWTRDANDSISNCFATATDGNVTTAYSKNSAYVRQCFILDYKTPIRQLADGSYDLVPEDPALAQGISTMADEEEVPLEIELDWPESDPLIARQWVYNTKGVYQTMLLGGVASTEDAPPYDPVLANNTWEMIAQACADRDPILDSWQVGDEKDEVINGETLTFVIVGKDHDDLADGSGKAPLTFGMKNLMAETRQMNATNTNSGSFAGSAMYSWLSGTIYPNLPAELKDAIKAVNKKTSSGGSSSSIRTDAMYLWLFSEIEVFGTTTHSFAGDGTQYPYFATTAERIKRLSNGASAATYWWERSPRRNTSGYFCDVDTSGSANYTAASNFYGVCFGFCV